MKVLILTNKEFAAVVRAWARLSLCAEEIAVANKTDDSLDAEKLKMWQRKLEESRYLIHEILMTSRHYKLKKMAENRLRSRLSR